MYLRCIDPRYQRGIDLALVRRPGAGNLAVTKIQHSRSLLLFKLPRSCVFYAIFNKFVEGYKMVL